MKSLFLIGVLFFVPACFAEDVFFVHGHAKYQLGQGFFQHRDLASQFGSMTPLDHDLDLRLASTATRGRWQFALDGEVLGVGGNQVGANHSLKKLGISRLAPGLLPNDHEQVADLTADLSDGNDAASVARLDRASVAYATEHIVVRAGRQAVSWGDGLVFQALDVLNPFSPTAVDKDYKPGSDMVMGQWLFSDGSDVQVLAVGKRDPQTETLAANESSFASRYQGRLDELDYQVVAASHVDETLLGGGVVKDFLDATWRCDWSAVNVSERGWESTVVANVDRSWILWEKNVYASLEYFHTDLGVAEGSYLAPSDALSQRISRGELFTLGKDYLAVGGRVELSPLVNAYKNIILNLHDESVVAQVRIVYDVRQDMTLMFGTTLPFGPRGSEFGGIALPDLNAYAASPQQFYLRLSLYF